MGKVLRAPKGTSRADRRRMAELGDKVDVVSQADARFFQRFQHRSHRIRPMSQAEREQMVLAGGLADLPADERWAVLVKQIVTGVRLRRFFSVMEGSDLDQSEDVCRGIYEHLTAPSGVAPDIERKIQAALEKRGAQ